MTIFVWFWVVFPSFFIYFICPAGIFLISVKLHRHKKGRIWLGMFSMGLMNGPTVSPTITG